MKIKKKIVLIGMMGSGKSTIGALLSKKMNIKFIDLDSEIETIEKKTISQIFKLKGEKYFREIEVKTILSFLNSKEKELVLSLGGGSFLNEKVRKNVKNNSLSFWLNWNPSTIIKRIRKSSKRPLIQGLNDQEIEKMIMDRNKYYAKSNFKIDCDNHKKNEILDRIVSILKENEIKS
jgi:shikimate kinase